MRKLITGLGAQPQGYRSWGMILASPDPQL